MIFSILVGGTQEAKAEAFTVTADKLQDSHAPWEWPGTIDCTVPRFGCWLDSQNFFDILWKLLQATGKGDKANSNVLARRWLFVYIDILYCNVLWTNTSEWGDLQTMLECLIDPFSVNLQQKRRNSHPYLGSSAIFGFKLIHRFCFLAFRPVSLTRLRMDLPRPKQLPLHDSTTATKTEAQPLSFVVRHLKKAGGPVLDALCWGARSISAAWLSG